MNCRYMELVAWQWSYDWWRPRGWKPLVYLFVSGPDEYETYTATLCLDPWQSQWRGI